MTNETIDKLVVDLELSTKDFNKQADNTEQRYDDLSKNLDKTSKKIKSKSKKSKKDLSEITNETKRAGEAFKSSGKATEKFFSPLTKGTLAFAAAAFTLKSVADGLANVAQRFTDVNTLSKETGIDRTVLTARANTEEYFNIPKGTYAKAAQMAAAEKGRWQSGQGISKEYQTALATLGVAFNPNNLEAMLNQIITNAHLKISDIPTRNQALSPLGFYGYGTNNLKNVDKKLNQNINIERGRSGLYEQSEKYRQEYIEAMQRLTRAFDKLALVLMPIATTIIDYISPTLEALSHPGKVWEAGLSSARERASKETPDQKRQRLELLKSAHPWITGMSVSPSVNNVNNQTNNITNNVRITTNDPGKVMQSLSAKGIQQKNLTSNYMSSR